MMLVHLCFFILLAESNMSSEFIFFCVVQGPTYKCSNKIISFVSTSLETKIII